MNLITAVPYGTFGQGEPQSEEFSMAILPASPTASALGQYGQIPVGLFTGTPNINIPIYTYKNRNISVPISLSYNSNGVKVDQPSSWVGLGWSLSAGGVITRTVRDEPDESTYLPLPPDLKTYNPETVNYIKEGSYDDVDTEPDMFSFNFLGYTGKFLLDENKTPYLIPYQNIKIQRTYESTNGVGGFEITTPDGVKYIFGGSGAVEKTKTIPSGSGCGREYGIPIETSWYLKAIEHPTGDRVEFVYQPYTFDYLSGASQKFTRSLQGGTGGCPGGSDCPTFEDKTCFSILQTNGIRLVEINGAPFEKIVFNSQQDRTDIIDEYRLEDIQIIDAEGSVRKQFNFSYIYSNSGVFFTNGIHDDEQNPQLKSRLFLKSLQEQGENLALKNPYEFDYEDINGLPPRLSYAQDHWGFFNGQDNSYFVPEITDYQQLFQFTGADREPHGTFGKMGLLNKITYPTKGYNEIEYEPHTYNGQTLVFPSKVPFSLNVTGVKFKEPVVNTDIINSVYSQNVKLEFEVTFKGQPDDILDPIHQFASIVVYENQIPVYERLKVDAGQIISTYLTLVKGKEYMFEITSNGSVISSGITFQYYNQAPTIVTKNIGIGGVRVKRVTSHDAVTSTGQVQRYYYNHRDTPDISSGKAGKLPYYFSYQTIRLDCGSDIACNYYDCKYIALNSNSQLSLYADGSNHVSYQFVTVSQGENFENGGVQTEFIVNFDFSAEQIWGENEILSAPKANTGWNNGLELKKEIFKNDGQGGFVVVSETSNEYTIDTRNEFKVTGVSIRRNFDPICEIQDNYICTAEDITKVYTSCDANHSHHWLLTGVPIFGDGETICVAPGANNGAIIWTHPCYEKVVGEPILNTESLAPFDVMQYKIHSRWNYLQKQSTTTYDSYGLNGVTTVQEFRYDNPEHAQLTTTKFTNSKGQDVESFNWYALDYDINNVAIANDLASKFIIGIPLKTEKIVNGKIVNGRVTEFNGIGLPLKIHSYENTSLVPAPPHDPNVILPPHFVNKATYRYNDDYNIKAMEVFNAPPSTFIWGYNSTLPIAKIQNALENEVAYSSFESDFEESWIFEGGQSENLNPAVPSSTFTIGQEETVQFNYTVSGFDAELKFTETRGTSIRRLLKVPSGTGVVTLFPGNWTAEVVYDPLFTSDFQLTIEHGLDINFSNDAKTGLRSLQLTTGITIGKSGFPPGSYELSYWEKGGSPVVSLSGSGSVFSTNSFQVDQNGWQLIVHEIQINGIVDKITISGDVHIDEVRFLPKTAIITTIAYDPIDGVISTNDQNHISSFYSYDEFSRLQIVRDHEQNILQYIEYILAGQN